MFHFCSVNLIVQRAEKKQKYFFRTFIFLNSQIELLVSFSRSTNVNVNMSLPNSNFEGNLFYASHFDIIETWKVNVAYRDIYYAKNFNFSYEWRLEFFVKKWNMYEAHILPRPLQQTCSLETTPLCLNTRLRVNKKFQNSH